jgi:hypothetical protein
MKGRFDEVNDNIKRDSSLALRMTKKNVIGYAESAISEGTE